MYIDTHAHMDLKRFDADRRRLLQAIRNLEIEYLVNPAISYESNFEMIEKFSDYDWIMYAFGIHPNCVGNDEAYDEEWYKGIKKLLSESCNYSTGVKEKNYQRKVIAIGETGLDFHRISRDKDGNPDEIGMVNLNRQYKWFRRQIELSKLFDLPLILHIRDADEQKIRTANNISDEHDVGYVRAHKEAIMILKEYKSICGNKEMGVVHCFMSDDYNDALEYMHMGYYLGIGGAVTYSENIKLKEIVRKVPLENIVLETDSPYIIPESVPGKRNTPLNIPIIAKAIADLKEISVEEVAEITTDNAKRLFVL